MGPDKQEAGGCLNFSPVVSFLQEAGDILCYEYKVRRKKMWKGYFLMWKGYFLKFIFIELSLLYMLISAVQQ